MASLMPQGKQQYFDANGDPLSGGKLYTYAAGTSTPQATYTDATGGVANTNPVVLNSRGEASVFFSALAYKLSLKTAEDVEIWTADNLLTGSGLTWVNVMEVGALGDGLTDDTAAIQAAIDSLIGTGGVVWLPKGNYRTSAPLLLYSDIQLWGQGWTSTFIRPLNSATFTAAQAVVMTADFTEDANLWNFYPPYPSGLHMGVGLQNICIDGNRANVANANGLMIYGGKWHFDNLAVINTAGHGIWTECGAVGSSTSGDDLHDYLNMHESTAGRVYLSNNDQHGWLYRGPNDSHIVELQVKASGWGALYQDTDTTINAGGIKIDSLHCYAIGCAHSDGYAVLLRDAMVRLLYLDSSAKGGLHLATAQSQISEIRGYLNNQTAAGDYWTVWCESSGNQIGIMRDVANNSTTGTAGGALKLQGQYNVVDNVRMSGAGTIAATAISVTGDNNTIIGGNVFGYNMTNGVALSLAATACAININLSTNTTGLNYSNSGKGRNRLYLNFLSNTTDMTTAVTISVSDQIRWTSDKSTEALPNTRSQAPAFTASYTPDLSLGGFFQVGTLTNNITINAPSGSPRAGDHIEFRFLQDATGGRTITWDATYKNAYSNTGNTANKEATIAFKYTGSKWIQINAFSGWM